MTGGFRAGAVFSTSFAQIPGFLAGHFSASWAHSMKIAALFLSIALPLCAATFNVRDFGATGDGKTFDTASIQKTLDACGAAGGGTVKFPPGIYLSTPLTIRTKTIFQLEAGATLLASTNQSDFMKVPGDWLQAKSGGDFIPFIGGKDLADVTFTGGGVIDGNGAVWWGEAEKARQIKSGYTLRRPNLIVIERCKNLRMENITLQNSPKFHVVPTECDGVVISNLTVLAPERAANTDAIDPSGCKNVLITKCKIDVGDDNVAIKAGKKVAGREFACEDITVTDCTFLHGHGMSIGSETAGGVRNVTVKNCTFANTENGIRIKSQRGKGGIVENIFCDGITMSNVNPAITLTCYYANNSAGDTASPAAVDDATKVSDKIPTYRQIRIRNLTATCPQAAGTIVGLPESCITDVVLENVKITAAKSFEIRNAKGIELKNVVVTVPKGEPFKLDNAEVSGLPAPAAK
jgi:polygalacturonase